MFWYAKKDTEKYLVPSEEDYPLKSQAPIPRFTPSQGLHFQPLRDGPRNESTGSETQAGVITQLRRLAPKLLKHSSHSALSKSCVKAGSGSTSLRP